MLFAKGESERGQSFPITGETLDLGSGYCAKSLATIEDWIVHEDDATLEGR